MTIRTRARTGEDAAMPHSPAAGVTCPSLYTSGQACPLPESLYPPHQPTTPIRPPLPCRRHQYHYLHQSAAVYIRSANYFDIWETIFHQDLSADKTKYELQNRLL